MEAILICFTGMCIPALTLSYKQIVELFCMEIFGDVSQCL